MQDPHIIPLRRPGYFGKGVGCGDSRVNFDCLQTFDHDLSGAAGGE
jgi:hypothetical protein